MVSMAAEPESRSAPPHSAAKGAVSMIDVILLGCGATMPTPERGLSAAVLRCGGRSVLFDCGEGTQAALRREKVSPVKIDLIALSHYHGDHVFGLPGLLQTMNCLHRTEPLTLTGPEGLDALAAPILALAGPLDYELRLLPEAELPLRSLHPAWPALARLRPFPTEHRVPSLGYAFELPRPPRFLPERARALGVPMALWKAILEGEPDAPILLGGEPLRHEGRILRAADLTDGPRKGLRVVFSGDTMPCAATREAARGADLLIHDATYGEDAQEAEAALWGHSTFRQATALAREAQASRLWLTHFSQAMTAPEAYLPEAAALFPGAVCGRDGLRLTLSFDH